MFQVKETLNTAESLLGDLSGFKGFKREASDLAEELQSYCKDQFESWVSEMMTAIDDAKQPLRYSLGCHCCNIMYVGLQYLRVTLVLRVEAYNTYTAVLRKVVRRNAHATIPKGNMGYDQYTVRKD